MVVVFDLDDTLYKEVDFVKSAYKAILTESLCYASDFEAAEKLMIQTFENGQNAIDVLQKNFKVSKTEKEMVEIYRFHLPTIKLSDDTVSVLDELKSIPVGIGLITDGRSLSQRNKFNALGLGKYISNENLFISDEVNALKLENKSFLQIMANFPEETVFVYVGDNTAKDFYQSNRLEWISVCLKDNGENIHSQNFECEQEYAPQYTIEDITELPCLIRKLKKFNN